ncbi:Flp pilus assembly complex ATPase component TadA [Myxococcota bacterium]|nr:Flp pilus assembly complex ATPase component TadA [Myxococcota bacterium]
MARVPASIARLFAPLNDYLSDPDVVRISIGGGAPLLVEGRGVSRREAIDYPPQALREGLEGLARRAGKAFDPDHPCLEVILNDGTHFLGLREPVVDAPLLTIQRPLARFTALEGLIEAGLLSGETATLLRAAIRGRLNIALVGATGSGLTSLAQALLAALPEHARVALLEESLEVELPQRAPLRLRPHHPGEGHPITNADLLYYAGLLNLDRLFIAEVQAQEAWEAARLLADRRVPVLMILPGVTADDAISRLEALALSSVGPEQGRAVPGLLSAGLDLVVTLGQIASLGQESARRVNRIYAVSPGQGRPQIIDLAKRDVFTYFQVNWGLSLERPEPKPEVFAAEGFQPKPFQGEVFAAQPFQEGASEGGLTPFSVEALGLPSAEPGPIHASALAPSTPPVRTNPPNPTASKPPVVSPPASKPPAVSPPAAPKTRRRFGAPEAEQFTAIFSLDDLMGVPERAPPTSPGGASEAAVLSMQIGAEMATPLLPNPLEEAPLDDYGAYPQEDARGPAAPVEAHPPADYQAYADYADADYANADYADADYANADYADYADADADALEDDSVEEEFSGVVDPYQPPPTEFIAIEAPAAPPPRHDAPFDALLHRFNAPQEDDLYGQPEPTVAEKLGERQDGGFSDLLKSLSEDKD